MVHYICNALEITGPDLSAHTQVVIKIRSEALQDYSYDVCTEKLYVCTEIKNTYYVTILKRRTEQN